MICFLEYKFELSQGYYPSVKDILTGCFLSSILREQRKGGCKATPEQGSVVHEMVTCHVGSLCVCLSQHRRITVPA